MSEMLSWPIQQLARARLEDGDKLSDAEKAAIDELMPGEAWKLYDPTISDPVKFEFDTQAFRTDMKKYTGIWLSVGQKCAGNVSGCGRRADISVFLSVPGISRFGLLCADGHVRGLRRKLVRF